MEGIGNVFESAATLSFCGRFYVLASHSYKYKGIARTIPPEGIRILARLSFRGI